MQCVQDPNGAGHHQANHPPSKITSTFVRPETGICLAPDDARRGVNSHVKITVRLFAVARDLAGSNAVEIEVEENATISDLRAALIEAVPALSDIAEHMMFSVNSEYAGDHTTITADSDIGCIPPVSGG